MDQKLELDQIQGTVLRSRPMPYAGSYLLFAVDDPEHGRTLLRRLLPHVTSAADWQDPVDAAWLNVVFSFGGLRVLGVPDGVLAGFPREFREPMRDRAAFLGDSGASDPRHWDMPSAFHVGLLLMAPDRAGFEAKLALGDAAVAGLGGVRQVHRLDVSPPPNLREHFGYADGISHPCIEGQGGSPLPGQGDPVRAGEFVLGYVNELGRVATGPGPEELWRNGTYVSVRKLRQDVARFRRFLRDTAGLGGEELLAAKMAGRWRDGSPLALCPGHGDPAMAADRMRNNDFSYRDDPKGLATPLGSHIRRVNPRDALDGTIVATRLHRLLRRGATYGPMLPEGVLDDDGVDRGLVLAFVNADPARQFEFVQSQWVNSGTFIAAGSERDPLAGNPEPDRGEFTYAARPVRRHLTGLTAFAVTRGGEHLFMPGLGGLRYIGDLPRR